MNLTLPYFELEQKERVSLHPSQMNGDILLKLKLNLKDKVEKRCNKYGYIDKVYKIASYQDGIMEAENLSGSAVYQVNYQCKIYMPMENTLIVSEAILVNPELIVCIHGPIKIFIPRENINTQNFDITRDFLHLKTKKILQLNQKVIIRIKSKRLNQGDKNIKCIGYLEDVASEEQASKFYQEIEEQIENTFTL
jgi:DNA-directed RNA polymerase subunit E'/Rpb7